jgi:hypothetical protein
MKLTRFELLPALSIILAMIGGCAGERLREGVYRGEHTRYRLGPLASTWQRHDSGADLAFFEPQLQAVIMVNSECPPGHDPPLTVAANSLLIGFTDRRIDQEEQVVLAGRQGLHRRLRAQLDGAPLTIDVFEVKKDDCLYDLVYLAPPGTAARGRAQFERFVTGFEVFDRHLLARSGGAPR